MEEKELDALADRLSERLIKARRAQWIDPDTHHEHHQFVSGMMETEQSRRARSERLRERVAGSVTLTLILGLLGAIGAWVMRWLEPLIDILKQGGPPGG